MAMKKELFGGTPYYLYFQFFLSVFSGLDVCYYCSIIIVSLLSNFVPGIASDFKKIQKLWHVVQKIETFSPLEEFLKITTLSFWFELFWKCAPYNWLPWVCFEFIDLNCRSAPKKLFTTCCSVFHRFCLVLPFLGFANLKLAFSLQIFFGNPEKQ